MADNRDINGMLDKRIAADASGEDFWLNVHDEDAKASLVTIQNNQNLIIAALGRIEAKLEVGIKVKIVTSL